MNCKECDREFLPNPLAKNKLRQRFCSRPCNTSFYNRLNKQEYENERLKRTYGITTDDYEILFSKQRGVCAICEKPEPRGRKLDIDHDHKSGKVRGLLCNMCNGGLGRFKDNAKYLLKASKYLKKYTT